MTRKGTRARKQTDKVIEALSKRGALTAPPTVEHKKPKIAKRRIIINDSGDEDDDDGGEGDGCQSDGESETQNHKDWLVQDDDAEMEVVGKSDALIEQDAEESNGDDSQEDEEEKVGDSSEAEDDKESRKKVEDKASRREVDTLPKATKQRANLGSTSAISSSMFDAEDSSDDDNASGDEGEQAPCAEGQAPRKTYDGAMFSSQASPDDNQAMAKKQVTRSLRVSQLSIGVFDLVTFLVLIVGRLKGDQKHVRHILVMLKDGSELTLVLFGSKADDRALFEKGNFYNTTFVKSSLTKPFFKVTDTPYELRLTPESHVSEIPQPARRFPILPKTKLQPTPLSQLKSVPLNKRIDVIAKIVAPSRASKQALLDYISSGRIPKTVSLFVVDSSRAMAKLVFDQSSGVHGVEAISKIFQAYANGHSTEHVVVFLHSVFRRNINGKSVVAFQDLSGVYQLADSHELHDIPNEPTSTVCDRKDKDIPKAVLKLFQH